MEDHFSQNPPELVGAGDISQRVASLEREVTKLHKLVMDLRADLRHIRGDS